jgi:hypothetical protein
MANLARTRGDSGSPAETRLGSALHVLPCIPDARQGRCDAGEGHM